MPGEEYNWWLRSYCNSTSGPTGSAPHSGAASIVTSSSSSLSSPTSSSLSDPITSSSSAPASGITQPSGHIPSGIPRPSGTGYPRPPTGNFTMPGCWLNCFEEYGVTNEKSLCYQPTQSLVGKCISSSCNASSTAEYDWWLGSYCNSTQPGTSGTAPVALSTSSSTYSVSATGSSTSSSSLPTGSAPASGHSSSAYPRPSGTGYPRPPTGNFSMPSCWKGCFEESGVSNEG